MGIDFARSDRGTVGIEWELACVDAETRHLTGAAPAILAAMPDAGAGYPLATEELLTNTVELVSGAHRRVADAMGDLTGMLSLADAAARTEGARLMSAGAHPFSESTAQTVTPKERYTTFLDRMRWWGDQLAIWGVHIHVGVDHPERAIALMRGFLDHYPHLLALSASSPYWAGADTGYASNRSMLFQQASTAGLPPPLTGWGDYERIVEDMLVADIVSEPSEMRWDVRPSAKLGTLEMRFCDAPATVAEVGALAALTQCLAEWLGRRLDDGDDVAGLAPWFVRENKWRAARYGLECDVIVGSDGAQRALRDDTFDLLDRLEPVARDLGCEAELSAASDLLDAGPGYERQRSTAAQADGDLTAVVDGLVAELSAR